MTVGIVVATFGNPKWADLAHDAFRSALHQTVPPETVVQVHGQTLAEARNAGARAMDTDWLIFVDGDDTIDRHYIEEMLKGEGDLRQPSTLGVYPDGSEDDAPVLIPSRSLFEGNYLVIGTMVRTELFERVGGFREWAMSEDWELWLRCWKAGATIGACPGAIYRVTVNDASRNHPDNDVMIRTYNEIRRLHQ